MNLKRAMLAATAVAAAAGWQAWGPPTASPDGGLQAPVTAVAVPAQPAAKTSEVALHDQAVGPAVSHEALQKKCTVESHYLDNGDGTTTAVYSCERQQPPERHPYEMYPTEALEALAYSDPDAAAELSLRWRRSDTVAAMSMAVRASALAGGDADPIVAFSNAYPVPTAIDGEPLQSTVRVKYVLGAVTKLLGDPRHATPYFEAIIREHSEDPEREIALLDRRAREIVEEMQQIQRDLSGSSTTGG